MDEGVAQGGHDNTNNAHANGAGAIAVGENHDSPIATNGSKAIGSVNDDSAVGMDNANVVSHPDDSAIAQGAGGVALNDTDHFAVSTGNNSPAIQDADQVASSVAATWRPGQCPGCHELCRGPGQRGPQ